MIILLTASLAASQNPTDPKKPAEPKDLRTDAVEFLRETVGEINNMRSLENRISFAAEMASLMWFSDAKEGRAMYQGLTGDLRQLLIKYDFELNNLAAPSIGEDEDYPPVGLFVEVSSQAQLKRKFQKALQMRQQITLSLAEHEPDMALAFYYDSVAALTSAEFLSRGEEEDSFFLLQLMNQIAESNAAKAAQLASKSLSKGVTYQHIELLKKIYAKDAEQGVEFASAVVGRLKTAKSDGAEAWVLSSLILFGEETAGKIGKGDDRKPVLTNQEIRDLVEILAQNVLSTGSENEIGNGTSYVELIEKYSPSRAAQIRAKNLKKNRAIGGSGDIDAIASPTAESLNSEAERREKTINERLEAEKKVLEDVKNLDSTSLSDEARSKVVTESRKIIRQTPGKDRKVTGLSLLAAQVAKAGDKELADEIMKEAESFVNSQPKNYQDYLLTWMLIAGYAEVDTAKAFPMLTDTILRLNGTIAAFVKSAEFIDVQGEIIGDGEVQVGQFGGSMLRNLIRDLKIAEPTLRSLAKADFAKTKAVTNNFDRPEARVIAKMMVLRTILSEKENAKDTPGSKSELQ